MLEENITQTAEATATAESTPPFESLSSADLFRQAKEESKAVEAPKEAAPALAPDAPVETLSDAPVQASTSDAPVVPSPGDAPQKVDAPDPDPEKTELKAKLEKYERERDLNQQLEATRQLEAQEQQVFATYTQRLDIAKFNEASAKEQMDAALEDNNATAYAHLAQVHANAKALREGIESESNYFLQTAQQRKLAENNKRHQVAVETTLKEYGLEPKHLIEIDPTITPSNFYGVLKTSLAAQQKQLEAKHQSEIKLVRDTAEKSVKEAQAKWRVESPGSVADKPAGATAGKAAIPFESKSSSDYFREAREERRRA